MKTVELVPHVSRPVDDREGHIPFEPFSLAEWVWTIVLVLVCFGIPMGMVIEYHLEQARLDRAAQVELQALQVRHE